MLGVLYTHCSDNGSLVYEMFMGLVMDRLD